MSRAESVRRRLTRAGRTQRQRRRAWAHLCGSSQRLALVQSREAYVIRVGDEAIGRDLYMYGEFDFNAFERVMTDLGRGQIGTLLDIGANIGPICIPAVARGLARRAVAVEPEPVNFSLLEVNVRLNSVSDRIRCVQAAAGSQRGGTVTLELAEVNFGDHRVAATSTVSAERGRREKLHDVPVCVMDDLVADADPSSDLIWMDVQGFEIEVLRGCTDLLERGVPLVMELQPMLLNEHGGLADLLDLLSGYRGFRDLRTTAPPHPLAELPSLYRSLGPAGPHTDILLTTQP